MIREWLMEAIAGLAMLVLVALFTLFVLAICPQGG